MALEHSRFAVPARPVLNLQKLPQSELLSAQLISWMALSAHPNRVPHECPSSAAPRYEGLIDPCRTEVVTQT